ncbi:MAG: hypothetical protein JWQ45_663 [Blastococcus sp.]|nr:hypothetical protein [Blastococcus sp.]
MELRVLQHFLAVAEAGNVTEGARVAHVSQPAMSRQMRSLERELGVELFTRGHGPLSLTHAGVRFVEVASDLLRRANNAKTSLRFDDRANHPLLRIVAPFSTIKDSLAPFIAENGHSLPLVDVVESFPSHVFENAEAIGADLGISSFPPPPHWRSYLLHSFGGITAQFPSSHELAQFREVPLEELAKHRLILMPSTHAARRVLDESLSNAGLRTCDPVEIGSPIMAQALAAAGHGVAIISTGPMFDLRARPVVHGDLIADRHLYAGWEADHYGSDVIEVFCGELKRWGTALSLDSSGRWLV